MVERHGNGGAERFGWVVEVELAQPAKATASATAFAALQRVDEPGKHGGGGAQELLVLDMAARQRAIATTSMLHEQRAPAGTVFEAWMLTNETVTVKDAHPVFAGAQAQTAVEQGLVLVGHWHRVAVGVQVDVALVVDDAHHRLVDLGHVKRQRPKVVALADEELAGRRAK